MIALWIVAALLVWLLAGLGLALLVGRVVRLREGRSGRPEGRDVEEKRRDAA